MKQLKKLKRENLKTIKGGNTPLCDMYLVHYNGYYACCSVPATNPCELKKRECLVESGMCDAYNPGNPT
ncbi:hypothetical protein REB14_13200 [Chryseobacterium sp. ES2]|uniref:Bacteriocin-type signal sequence-containing protein n=1 Tax=Chryseobacterium metallicongregator TaxID=3073042 RepID=A0ABU1E5Q8_9FLAO|nr:MULTISPECIES: hypothetical protein [Chryseobacterium]MDR4953135.1 hypothetical protein [Chryseobacterium sp. ES2]